MVFVIGRRLLAISPDGLPSSSLLTTVRPTMEPAHKQPIQSRFEDPGCTLQETDAGKAFPSFAVYPFFLLMYPILFYSEYGGERCNELIKKGICS